MKKTLLQEVKQMNKIAGTQMTREQEIAFIKNRLQELEFTHQASFDAYRKNHKMRPDTKVKIAGKETTVADASKKPGFLQKLGSKLFGKKETPIEMPKPLDAKNPLNRLTIYDPKRGSDVRVSKAMENPEKYKHLAAKIQSLIDTDPDGKEAQKILDKRSKDRKAAAIRKKEWDKKQAEKEKEYQQWRKDNPELAKKKDAEDAERRKKEQEKRDAEEKKKRKKYSDFNKSWDDDYSLKRIGGGFGGGSSSGGGFGGFGGGSFGGGGASGGW